MRLLRQVFFQLINRKLGKMRELHDEDAVVLRRANRKQGRGGRGGIADNNGNLGSGRRLSWSISDLSRLPVVRTNTNTNTLLKTRCSRVRNASISSCSLSSGSSSFSLRSNGSFRRKARIPVSGFTERAFLANERKMIEDAEIIVKEDFEPVVKAEEAAERLTDNEGLGYSNTLPGRATDKTTSLSAQPQQKTSSDVGQQGRKSCDVARRKTTASEDRESLSSVSSFSSSFVIDRIFHWRKSSSKSCKDSISGGALEEYPDDDNTTAEAALDNDKQIDCLAARSLSLYTSVTSEGSTTAEQKLPLKPLRFQIKQLESVLSGSLCPPPHLGDQMEVQLKLDSLRVMQSLEMMNKSKEYQSQIIYDFPRYLY